MSSQQVISFLNKYTITHIDSQTSIITQMQNFTSECPYQDTSFMKDHKNVAKEGASVNTKTPACYLIKDLIIPDSISVNGSNEQNKQNEKMLASILETLSHHQQLNNKYILTLIHYEMFIKNIPYTPNNNIDNNAPTQRYFNPPNYHNASNHSFNEKSQVYSNVQYKNPPTVYTHSQLQQSRGHSRTPSQNTIINTMIQNQNESQYQEEEHDSIANTHKHDQCTRFSRMFNNTQINNQQNNPYEDKSNNSNVYSSGPHNAIRAIYQYGTLTLKQEIANRIASSTQFQEEELWAILATIVQALSYLQEEEIAYGVLGTDKIFINNSLVKILDPSATASDPLLVTQGRLYSPQILNGQENIDIFKSDVYIVGLILLECGLLVDLSKEIEPDLNKHKNIFRQVYSKELFEVMANCLEVQSNSRPTFRQLKQQVGKQLNWADFSHNYDHTGEKILQPMDNDKEDLNNPTVQEIEFEYQECHFDILFEGLGEHDIKGSNRKITQYQRARLKYLGEGAHISEQTQRNSQSSEEDLNQIHAYESQRSHSHKNRHNSSASPMETKRNGKYNSANHYNHQNKIVYYERPMNDYKLPLPHLNMAISESVYTDGSIPGSKKNSHQKQMQKNSKKTPGQQFQNFKPHKSRQRQQKQREEYISFGQNVAKPIINPPHCQKIKKTKLIKQKLVRSNNIEQASQIFGAKNKNIQISKNVQNPNFHAHLAKQNTKALQNLNKYEESIQQQLYQESQSSYLYYNTNKSGIMEKQVKGSKENSIKSRDKGENVNAMRKSQNLGNSGMMKNSGIFRKSENFENLLHEEQRYGVLKPLNHRNVNENENLFTDPSLMKIIKDDLARISTTKNMQNLQSMQIENSMKQNRYFK